MLYLLNLRKQSNQVELDQFFRVLHEQDHAQQVVTKSALTQARKQLSPSAFVELNEQLINHVYHGLGKRLKRWKGHRLCAIDGSSVRLPNTEVMAQHFGEHGGRYEQTSCALAMTSVFYDVLNRLAIDAGIYRHRTSEYACAADHLAHAQANDLILYDRGYNAFWLYALHRDKGLSFCIRAKTHQSTAVKAFVASGVSEAVVQLYPTQNSLRECVQRGIPASPVTVRLVRVELPSEVEVLITNLMDAQFYPAEQFAWLYHQRWGIEENFKRIKQWVEIENFSGKSALSVRQDFHAKILATNLTALMSIGAQQRVDQKSNKTRYVYQINFAQALSKMKHVLIQFIHHAKTGKLHRWLRDRLHYISQTVEPVRPERQAPRRVKNIKNKIHFPAYKSTL